MEAAKIIEKLLTKECITREKPSTYDCCIVTASSTVWRLLSLFPESYIVANTAAQVFPNLASIYYAVKELKVPLVAVTCSTLTNLENFVKLTVQTADVEFKLLKKVYEENVEILSTLYEGDDERFNAALMEVNIDTQIDKLLSVPEFEELVKAGKLSVCGLILDETGTYGEKVTFYLTNFNGIKDPEELRNLEALEPVPEAIRKQKIKRVHVQF